MNGNSLRFFLLGALLFGFTKAPAQLTFTTNNATVTITGYAGSPTTLAIPASTNGYPVTSVGTNAFHNVTSLLNVTIPDSVTSIADSAFYFCTGLTNVTLGNNVGNIGIDAFSFCYALTNVVIPDSVTRIGGSAFQDCIGLTNVTIGTGVTNIGDLAFINCFVLTNITVNPGNTNYSSLGGVLYDKSQTTLIRCPGGKSGIFVVTNGVTTIGNSAFSFCGQLASVIITNNVTSIGTSAFNDSSILTNVTIGTNVTSIGSGAFDGCLKLKTVTVATNNPNYSSINGVLFNQSQTLLIKYPDGKTDGSYTPPGSVTSIADFAFETCFGLTNVTIGDNVTNFDGGAFYDCIYLTIVVIGAGLSDVGYDPFDGCADLKTISVSPLNPDYSSLNGVLFNKNQTTLVKFPGGIAGGYTIPNTVTGFVFTAFINDFRLTSVYFPGNAPTLPFNEATLFYDPVTVYYQPGTTNWGTTFGGMPAVLWNPQAQALGVRTNQLGFTISGNTNLVIVVDACTNLANPVWQPVQTNTLASGPAYFSDPHWTNYPNRYYRLRSP